ncbi:D-Ala-D-Ala carboxypeptidase family metallohydrolase [Luteolibacter soli]|uniref:D-Ala-D-Ala carboxypeptidase family metallohydrolase n=1 Tax=Luteolibacter soli TaxID=3135280 RepID=A0ABU9ARU9_9BACT
MLIDPSRGESADAQLQSRRGALCTLGAGALALLATTGSASAFFSKKPGMSIFTPSAPVDFSDLPQDWVTHQGGELKAYADFLASLRLERLTPHQVIASHAKQRGSVWNSLPPRTLWRQMAPTLRVIDRVSAQLGQPVKEVVSAYRAPSYNARCPGAKSGSYHQANVAIDVVFDASPSTVAQTARTMRSSGLFRGGVGRYPTFTHIDTRGQNVDW